MGIVKEARQKARFEKDCAFLPTLERLLTADRKAPPLRMLARASGMSPYLVACVMDRLERQGIIKYRRGTRSIRIRRPT